MKLSREGFCRNLRGFFPNKFPGEFCHGFFGGFLGAFFLGRNRRKKSPKNPRQNSNQNLGVSLPKSTLQGSGLEKLGTRKSMQTFFGQSFSRALRVMDVCTKNRGRPHRKVRFPPAPVVGRNFLTPGHQGIRVRNVRRNSDQKVYVYVVFSSLRNTVEFSMCI